MNTATIRTTETETSSRIIRSAIGFSLIIPVVGGFELNPMINFGMSFIGSCMVFSAMIGKKATESYVACIASFGIAALLITAGGVMNPLSIAAISIISIAALTNGLIGLNTANSKVKQNNNQQQPVGTYAVAPAHTAAANDRHNLAA